MTYGKPGTFEGRAVPGTSMTEWRRTAGIWARMALFLCFKGSDGMHTAARTKGECWHMA